MGHIWFILVLHPHGVAPTFFDSWSPGAGFIPIISTKGINQIKKGKSMHTKRLYIHFLKDGRIPCGFNVS